jgi:hypothetical protein
MPTYTFKNKETGEVFEKFMGIAARDEYLKENPNLEPMISGAPTLGDPVRLGIRKVPDGFKEVLNKIHERMPGSTLKDNIR